MPPVPLSRYDAREAARACRALAWQQRKQAAGIPQTAAEAALLRSAERLEQLAVRFEKHAESEIQSPGRLMDSSGMG